jgi:methyl-accepting chemotaxis protein
VIDRYANIGIGTTSPSQKLHLDGNLRVTGAYYDSNNSAGTSNQILSSTGTGTDWIDLSAIAGVDGSGSASLVAYWVDGNTITGSAGFFFNNSTNTLTVPSLIESSAERFKTNITPLTGSLEKVQQLQGVVFNRVDVNSNREIGFIADQVEKIYPELVSYDDDGKVHGLQYPRVTAVLVESIKELTQQIQDQNIFIQDLKSRIEYLENKLR